MIGQVGRSETSSCGQSALISSGPATLEFTTKTSFTRAPRRLRGARGCVREACRSYVLQPRDRVENDLGDVVPELLGEVDAKPLALVTYEERADLREPARSGEAFEVEVGQA